VADTLAVVNPPSCWRICTAMSRRIAEALQALNPVLRPGKHRGRHCHPLVEATALAWSSLPSRGSAWRAGPLQQGALVYHRRAGGGKTTCINAILRILGGQGGLQFCLCAPTPAAKRNGAKPTGLRPKPSTG